MTPERKDELILAMHTANAVAASMAMASAVIGTCVATGDDSELGGSFDLMKLKDLHPLLDSVIGVQKCSSPDAT